MMLWEEVARWTLKSMPVSQNSSVNLYGINPRQKYQIRTILTHTICNESIDCEWFINALELVWPIVHISNKIFYLYIYYCTKAISQYNEKHTPISPRSSELKHGSSPPPNILFSQEPCDIGCIKRKWLAQGHRMSLNVPVGTWTWVSLFLGQQGKWGGPRSSR